MKLIWIFRHDNDESKTEPILKLCEKHSVEAEVFSSDNLPNSITNGRPDVILVLGGDGAMLRAAHIADSLDVPIIGINYGRVGYLAEIESSNLDAIEKLLSGKYSVSDHIMLKAQANSDVFDGAMNDIVFTSHNSSKLTSIELYASERLVGRYYGDGMVIATPAGSTAYSLSAGGPVVDHSLNVLCVTPICSHSLTSRPMVFSPEEIFKIKNISDRGTDVCVTADGIDFLILHPGEEITVSKSKLTTKIATVSENKFFQLLRKKITE